MKTVSHRNRQGRCVSRRCSKGASQSPAEGRTAWHGVLGALNNTRCKPPLPGAELVVIANGKARVPPGDGSAPAGGLPPLDAYEGDAARENVGSYAGEEWGEPPPQAQPYPPIPPLAELRIDPAKLAAAQLTPRCVVESYLYADVAVFPGPGGTGKTTLFLFEDVHIVLGWPLYSMAAGMLRGPLPITSRQTTWSMIRPARSSGESCRTP